MNLFEFTVSLQMIITLPNIAYPQEQPPKKNGAVIIRTDTIPVDSTEYYSSDPMAVLGLSKEHASKEKKKQVMEGRFFFNEIATMLAHTFKDNSAQGKSHRKSEIKYYNNLYKGVNLLRRDGSDARQWWNPGRPLKVLIHGLTSSVFEPDPLKNIAGQFIFQIADTYKAKGTKYNVITVDWTALSTHHVLDYYKAVESVPYAGDDLAEFLIRLKNKGLIEDWKEVHLIGHSLGSHAAGVAGNKLQSLPGGGKVGRITGVDPAGPLYDNGSGDFVMGLENALDSSDAEFVDIIHCNGRYGVRKSENEARLGALGSTVVAGHADFYPDGGEWQKVCSVMDHLKGCSHFVCTQIFAMTIDQNFLSCPCDNYDSFKRSECSCTEAQGYYLGEPAKKEAKGKYFLDLGYWKV